MNRSEKTIKTWEVDKILEKKVVGGRIRYLVKWRRFTDVNTWEMKDSFADPSIIDNFERTLRRRTENIRLLRSNQIKNERPSIGTIKLAPKSDTTNSLSKNSTGCLRCKKQNEIIESITNLLTTEFHCSICHDIFKDPRMTECGHCFCDKCITEWKIGHISCPLCRAILFRGETKIPAMNEFIVKATRILSKRQ